VFETNVGPYRFKYPRAVVEILAKLDSQGVVTLADLDRDLPGTAVVSVIRHFVAHGLAEIVEV